MVQTIYVVRVFLVDGGVADLMMFTSRSAAAAYAQYLCKHAGEFGYDVIEVRPRLVIGHEVPAADDHRVVKFVPGSPDVPERDGSPRKSKRSGWRVRAAAALLSSRKMVWVLIGSRVCLQWCEHL